MFSTRRFLLVLCVGAAVVVLGSMFRASGSHGGRALTLQRMALIERALDRYAIDNGGLLPTDAQGLGALVTEPRSDPIPRNWRGPYVESPEILRDGWGRPFRYGAPGGGTPPRPYDLWSYGRDGVQGGEGEDADINSSQPKTRTP